jgi:mannose-6-phosphate isomerase-like protein (cupin superfamily)
MSSSNPSVAALDAFMTQHAVAAQDGLLVKNLSDQPVHWRADRGNSAAYFKFDGLLSLEAHISEIAPGQKTAVHRHTCEALFYVVAGRGGTVLWTEGEPRREIVWQAGDLFITPFYCWHFHVNTDAVSARYLEITNIPLMKALGTWSIEAGRGQAR